MKKWVMIFVIVVMAALSGYAARAYADSIGPDCLNGSCNGSIYTLTSDFLDVGSSLATDTFNIMLTINTAGFKVDPLVKTSFRDI